MSTSNNEELKYILEIKTEEEFNALLKRSRAMVYIEAEWSGPQRVSKQIVTKALLEIGVLKMPFFIINASERILYLEEWLLTQRNVQPSFIYGGWGETILLKNGQITDFIGYPAKLGYEKTKEIIKDWQK